MHVRGPELRYTLGQEWKDAALALDEYLHFEDWKAVDEDPYYDWKLVKKVGHNCYRPGLAV